MCKEMKPMTFEEVQKLRSETHWDKLRNEEPDTIDPEALYFSEIMSKEGEKKAKIAEKPFE